MLLVCTKYDHNFKVFPIMFYNVSLFPKIYHTLRHKTNNKFQKTEIIYTLAKIN